MSRAVATALAAAAALGWTVPPAAAGQGADQAAAATTLPRTPDGRPDLQGYWTTQTFTPLERPDHLVGREFFTEEEAAALQRQLTAEGVDPSAREILHIADPDEIERYKYQANRTREERHHIHYDNEIWLRTPVPKGLSSRRTSLITYPPDGRFPPLTPVAAARASRRRRPRGGIRARSTATRPGP